MRMLPNDEERRIYLEVKNLETNLIEDFRCWYDYDVIENVISKKMNILALGQVLRQLTDILRLAYRIGHLLPFQTLRDFAV